MTALRFNVSGSLLASGSRDTDLIMWDVVGEAGLYRLRGHKDQVTDLVSGTVLPRPSLARHHTAAPIPVLNLTCLALHATPSPGQAYVLTAIPTSTLPTLCYIPTPHFLCPPTGVCDTR